MLLSIIIVTCQVVYVLCTIVRGLVYSGKANQINRTERRVCLLGSRGIFVPRRADADGILLFCSGATAISCLCPTCPLCVGERNA